ncbi:hypothetical protein [Magnetospirillum molischianum]|uniref:Uncharacterized protein n=1 Tax=Magnetospirillum molischianum DSM 120 TaxID=1150626 RepID=H8FYE5_MAGML|nr:hypothetical protein [Magnetospirillum molischianum]CCG43211.1 hypothetical protein PHAMO_80002 [Magnetospirillum molischianum DSM 120]CCG43383.1 hypothetical protein PHAMO_80174 [Magnetospirillum molischianum DSM 120]
MNSFDYTNSSDLERLRLALVTTSDHDRAMIVAFCMTSGLMLPKGFAMRWLWWVSRKNRFVKMTAALTHPKTKPLLDDMWRETINWMVAGKDQNDPKSAGGWNSNELNLFVEFLRFIGVFRRRAA